MTTLLWLFFLSTQANSKEAWEGRWSPNQSECKDRDKTGEDATILITQKRYESWETSCRVKKVVKQGSVFTLALACSGEGEEWSEEKSFVYDGKHLQIVGYKSNYVKCK